MAVPHISVDDVVDRLDGGRHSRASAHAVFAAIAATVAVLDVAADETGVLVLLWVPVVGASALAGSLIEALAGATLAVAVGVASLPSGSPPGVVAAEVIGRAVGLCLVIATAAWLAGAGRELARRSHVDGATGLLNRTAFSRALERERQRALRTGTPLSLVYFDVDDLKAVNDRYGHAAGDALLIRFAGQLDRCRRTIDVAARLGGDEFALLLPMTDPEGTSQLLERLAGMAADGERSLPASAGAVCWSTAPPAEEMLRVADEVMYGVKRSGGGTWTIVDARTDPPRDRRRHQGSASLRP